MRTAASPAAAGTDAAEVKESERAVELGRNVHDLLANAGLPSELKRNEFVGPQVGKELSEDGLVAIVVVLVGILVYIAMRFQLKFGAAAIIGEVHDVLVTGAIFVLIGREFDTTVLAGFLETLQEIEVDRDEQLRYLAMMGWRSQSLVPRTSIGPSGASL